MTVYEILKFNREIIERLEAVGIRPGDCKYIDLYAEYVRMRHGGEKVTYVVSFLAEKYNVSERKVYGLLKKFASDCNAGAV